MRPHVVWFGEMPLAMERIETALETCDLFVSIGTSGAVYPAAGFVQSARYAGARTVEINLAPTQGVHLFDEGVYGPCDASPARLLRRPVDAKTAAAAMRPPFRP